MKNQVFKPFIVFFCFFFVMIQVFGYDPGRYSKVDVSIAPEISILSSSGNFTYKLTINSSHKSLQEIMDFLLVTSESNLNSSCPLGWEISLGETHPALPKMIRWGSGWGDLPEGKIIPDHDYVDPSPFNIKPGESLSGFSFESKSLPGIVDFYAAGYAKLLTTEEEPESTFPPGHTFLDDLFKGTTIGPVGVSDTSPGGLIDRLILLKDETPKYNWITNQGILNSLNVKLKAAKESIARGNKKAAVNQLEAFIRELEAQKGKHVDPNAWALLKSNAEYLIFKLGN